MDISIFVVLWIVFIIFQNVADRKKRPQRPTPPNEDERLDFEIPTLANDPNLPGEESQVVFQDTKQAAEVREIDLTEFYRQKKIDAQAERKISRTQSQPKTAKAEEQKNFSLDLTPASAMNAIILGEILGKPKALRHR